MRAGRSVPKWLGRDLVAAAINTLEPDCALALTSAAMSAVGLSDVHVSQTHCARDGFVQKYELFAMPLASRWGPPLIAIFVKEDGVRYSLVDAIFRSTEHGVVALAAIRDKSGDAVDFQVVDLNEGAATLMQADISNLRWRRLTEGKHAFNSPLILMNLKKTLEGEGTGNFELKLPRTESELWVP